MEKKQKIIDVLFFNGDLEMLFFRLTELNPHIDSFIILETETSLFFEKNKKLFKKWENKIIHVVVTTNNSDKTNYDIKFGQLKFIFDVILNLNLDFEDIIMVSNVNEIPNFGTLYNHFHNLKFDMILLYHTNFIWNKDYVSNKNNSGTIIFTETSLKLHQETLISNYLTKNETKNFPYFIIENGWSFFNFFNPDNIKNKNIKYLRDNILPVEELVPSETYQLIKCDKTIELPKNIHLLPYHKIDREKVKKHLIIIDQFNITIDKSNFDSISEIEFIHDVNEIFAEKKDDNTLLSKIFVPNVILYEESLEFFQKKYKLNEIKKILTTVFPQEQDEITFLNNVNKKTLIWGDITDKPLFDLLIDIM